MSRRLIFPFVMVVAIVASLPSLAGEPVHSLGRHFGHGWSDGYHSRAACPPKRHFHSAPDPVAAPMPWWMVPAAEAEPLPYPSGKEPATSRYSPASGPTLFRKPGDGAMPTATMMR